jgi:hypothetical protein
MSFVHGKDTYFSLGGSDLSTFTNTSTFTRAADVHDSTTYGKDDHTFEGGLGVSSMSAGGMYDNTASTGPRAVIEPMVGTKVAMVRRPDGTGSGKAQDAVDVVVTSYVETNPVADMVTWSVELQGSDAVNSTAQV